MVFGLWSVRSTGGEEKAIGEILVRPKHWRVVLEALWETIYERVLGTRWEEGESEKGN